MIERKADGSLFTVSSWAAGAQGLLAEAEYVAFAKPLGLKPGMVGYGKWERVMQVAGEFMRRTVDYPPRFHVDRFPSVKELAAMDLSPTPP